MILQLHHRFEGVQGVSLRLQLAQSRRLLDFTSFRANFGCRDGFLKDFDLYFDDVNRLQKDSKGIMMVVLCSFQGFDAQVAREGRAFLLDDSLQPSARLAICEAVERRTTSCITSPLTRKRTRDRGITWHRLPLSKAGLRQRSPPFKLANA